MKYQHIKKVGLSHKTIAEAMGYRSVNSFRSSSAHRRIMTGIDKIIEQTVKTLKK